MGLRDYIYRPKYFICLAILFPLIFSTCTNDVQKHASRLQHKDPAVRRKAMLELGKLKDDKTVDALIGALHNQDPIVRVKAVTALRKLKDKKSVPPLIEALKDESARVRREVPWALVAINDQQAVQPLIAALEDNDERVRKNAIWALKKLDAIETLTSYIKDNKTLLKDLEITVVTIGYGSNTEQAILAEILRMSLVKEQERASELRYVVNTKKLNNIQEIQQALQNGDILIGIEYSGEAYLDILGLQGAKDIQQIYEIVKKGYKERFELIWLKLFGVSRLISAKEPPSYAAPVMRKATLYKQPALARWINKLAGKIDNPTMAELVEQVEQNGKPVEVVAGGFLKKTERKIPADSDKD